MIIKPLKKAKKIKGTRDYDKELWRIFSAYIRKRDAGICFTCGRKAEGKGYHAGHFIPTGANGGHVLKYDERNVNGQCWNCNINLGGNGAKYAEKMAERYGQKTINELWAMHARPTVWGVGDFTQKIIYYKNKLKYFFAFRKK